MQNEKYYIFRSNGSGVWFGQKKEIDGTTATITNARRIWEWQGAASLSQLAVDGPQNPSSCKFPVAITDPEGVTIFNLLEIIPCTDQAVEAINNVKIWKK